MSFQKKQATVSIPGSRAVEERFFSEGKTDIKQISENFPRGIDFIWKRVGKEAILFRMPNIQQKQMIYVKNQTNKKQGTVPHTQKKRASNRN